MTSERTSSRDAPVFHRVAAAHSAPQPYRYPPERSFEEPDWRRLPGYRDVTPQEWESAKWQRQHTVKSLEQLVRVFGDLIPQELVDSIARD